ncbi:MAG: type I-E CRISPR-associated protein Cas7/Cse4/CasC [Armatimonadota bacterium]
MLVEIHILQNHSPSNLNRDDTGSPKDCTFGGVRRARISSQCLKRSIRRSDIFGAEMSGFLATRTRKLPELVRRKLIESGLDKELAGVAAKKASGFGTKEGKEQTDLTTAQTMLLTDADIDVITQVLREAALEAGNAAKFEKIAAKDLQSRAELRGYRPATVDIAMFGRMITSEAFRDAEASVQVAHAISTHKVDQEFDYFTAVDDLSRTSAEEEDAGADMIGDVEFNSACYYKYFSVDFNGLVKNLTGESAFRSDITDAERKQAADIAAKAVESFIRSAIFTTPSGKQNSFAANQLPAAVLVEVRPYNTPVSYANAFVEPARQQRDKDLVQASMDKLGKHVEALTKGFNLQADSRLMLTPEHPDYSIEGVDRVDDLGSLCSRLKEVISNA